MGAGGIKQQALANNGTAQGISTNATNNANGLYGALAPALGAEAAHPAGYTPTQIAAQNTASQQSAGGSQAGTVGQAGLMAARTRNAGSGAAAIAQGSRNAATQLGNSALKVQTNNADLQQKQQQAGLSGLANLYAQNNGTQVNALNAGTGALNAATQATNAGWDWTKLLSGVGGSFGGGSFSA